MTYWTSLLSWRNRETTGSATVKGDPGHVVPDVTHSHSSETATTMNDDTPTRNHSPQYYTDSDIVTLHLQVLRAPDTPEGLRPRPSMERIRQECVTESDGGPSRDFLVEKTLDPSRMLPAVPSRSWSMPSQPPAPPTNGLQSQPADNHQNQESMQLEYGKTKTAVGSFVAYLQQGASCPPSPHAEGYEADGSQCGTPYRTTAANDPEDLDDTKIHHNRNYRQIDNGATDPSKTPTRSMIKRGFPLSPFSTNISLEASPSSLAKPYSRKADSALPDNGFSSATALLEHVDHGKEYDFRPLDPCSVEESKEIHVKFSSDQTHVSGMTQSVALDTDSHAWVQPNPLTPNEASFTFGRDESLRRQKVQNQRRMREELFLAIVERLQDNVQLVHDIFPTARAARTTQLRTVLSMERQGILTGFSPQARVSIIRHMSAMLNELSVAQPEEFFLSPSQAQQYVQPHNDLQCAISFCRVLVQISSPFGGEEKDNYQGSESRWSLLPGVQSALGISSPQSPPGRACGGDTSVFTLPSASADTPMTSNVSLSTTIASSREGHAHSTLETNARQVRQALLIVASMIQRLSLCCHSLVEMDGLKTEKTVRISKEIKCLYQQMMTVDRRLLSALVNAFELKISPPALSRIISDEEEGTINKNLPESVPSSPPRVSVAPPSARAAQNSPSRSCASSFHDLFSPQTLDMMSDKLTPGSTPVEYDDLRRQVGSTDHDDARETRDGPETSACA
jgi:hypothetical protein